jgi:hypothetical protein
MEQVPERGSARHWIWHDFQDPKANRPREVTHHTSSFVKEGRQILEWTTATILFFLTILEELQTDVAESKIRGIALTAAEDSERSSHVG